MRAKIMIIWIFEPSIQKFLSCTDVLLCCLKSIKKFVTAFFEHVLKNSLVFHFNDKIPSLHTSNIKLYQLTNANKWEEPIPDEYIDFSKVLAFVLLLK